MGHHAAHLKKLRRLLQEGQPLSANQSASLVAVCKDMVNSLSSTTNFRAPTAAMLAAALQAMEHAAVLAASSVHRGQVLLERSRLLQVVGKPAEANDDAEAAATAFLDQVAAWQAAEGGRAPAATAAAAGASGSNHGSRPVVGGSTQRATEDPGETEGASVGASVGVPRTAPPSGTLPPPPPSPPSSSPSGARMAAATALASLLDVTVQLRQLGQGERSNVLLSEAVRVAPLLPSSVTFMRAMNQLTDLTGD